MPITWKSIVDKALAGDEEAAGMLRDFADYFDQQIGDGFDGMICNPQLFNDGQHKPCCQYDGSTGIQVGGVVSLPVSYIGVAHAIERLDQLPPGSPEHKSLSADIDSALELLDDGEHKPCCC
jgi:hypothetical protein